MKKKEIKTETGFPSPLSYLSTPLPSPLPPWRNKKEGSRSRKQDKNEEKRKRERNN